MKGLLKSLIFNFLLWSNEKKKLVSWNIVLMTSKGKTVGQDVFSSAIESLKLGGRVQKWWVDVNLYNVGLEVVWDTIEIVS